MDTLQVRFIKSEENLAEVHYRWIPVGTKEVKRGGVVRITVGGVYTKPEFLDNRPLFAEMTALFHLLESGTFFQGERLGKKLTLVVSYGAIKKAAAKKALKQDDAGKTDDVQIAAFARFLATKYFEAAVVVDNAPLPVLSENATIRDFEVALNETPTAVLSSTEGDVIVTRHAMNRVVQRIIGVHLLRAGMSFEDLPNERWSRAWRFIRDVLPQAREKEVSKSVDARLSKKYGTASKVLYHESSRTIFVLKKESYGLLLVTVMVDDPAHSIFPPLLKMAGQRLVRA